MNKEYGQPPIIYQKLLSIDPDSEVIFWDKLHENMNQALGMPVSGLPKSVENYYMSDKNGTTFYLGKYVRNSAVIQSLESFIQKRDYILLGIEYFQGKITLQRHASKDLGKHFKDILFFEQMLNAYFTSMDIYAKTVSWYYDIPGKENQGFDYTFIINLQKVKPDIASQLKVLFGSKKHINLRKNMRNPINHSHANLYNLKHTFEISAEKISIKRPEKFDLLSSSKDLYHLYQSSKKIIKNTLHEMSESYLGVDSDTDIVLFSGGGEAFKRLK